MTGERDAADSSDPSDLPDPPADVAVEPATLGDRLDILRILDAAMLATDADAVDDRIAAGDALVARSTRTDGVVGALVAVRPDPDRLHVDAVAIRRARRSRGIGSALVAAAVRAAEYDPGIDLVTAEFDPKVAGFYRDLGFDVTWETDSEESDRLRGRRRVGGNRAREGSDDRRD